jgi:flagellar L-ring protein precursor FlgH
MKTSTVILLAILATAACAVAAEPAGSSEPAATPTAPAALPAPAAYPAAPVAEAASGSVWGSAPNPLADKVYKQHDLITIVINEQSNTDTKLQTTLDRKLDPLKLEIAKAFNIKTTGGGGVSYEPLTATSKRPDIDINGERKHEGTGEIKHDETFTAKVTAEVIEVMPNGQLVLEARKRVKMGEETTCLVLTGRIRPEDVGSDNTVSSDRVADPHIQYNPEGAVADANKRSWLTRVFDFINIF